MILTETREVVHCFHWIPQLITHILTLQCKC